ncbi:uncharacterized protein ACNLHF_011802 isoform 1-T3 [Anomaloglossus baeobatrachus]|uniref:uncharacterized protein LOC142295758 n=1 Tax=Anomaloglossus baeobatrachus TaxID=238106 RepID=UPI003F4F8B65
MNNDHSSSTAPDQKDTSNDWPELNELLDEVFPTRDSEVSAVADGSSVFHPVVGDEIHPKESTNYQKRDLHEAQRHLDPTYLSNVLERGFTGIQEVRGLRTSVRQLHPSVRQIHTSVRQLHPSLRQIHTSVRQLHPSVRQIHTSVRQLHPSLRQIHTSVRQIHTSVRQIHTSVRQIHTSVRQLVDDMKECVHTMRFCTTRMLAFQEMITTASETTHTLQSGVHLTQANILKDVSPKTPRN